MFLEVSIQQQEVKNYFTVVPTDGSSFVLKYYQHTHVPCRQYV
jgi:hypothetical protein